MALIERIDLQTRVAGEKAYAPDEFVTFSQLTAGTGIELTQDTNRDIQINVTGATSNDFLKRSAGDYATFDLGTLATNDILLVEDVDDSNTKKKVTVQDIADLASGESLPSGTENQTLRYNSSDELEATSVLEIDESYGSYNLQINESPTLSDIANCTTISHHHFQITKESESVNSHSFRADVTSDDDDDAIIVSVVQNSQETFTVSQNGAITTNALSGTGDAYIGADTNGKLKRMTTPSGIDPAGTEHQTLRYDTTNGWEATSVLKVYDTNYNIIGGYNNVLSPGFPSSRYSGIFSGKDSSLGSDSDYIVICGGINNVIGSYSSYSSILGGRYNSISGYYSSVPGGRYLKIGDSSFGFRGGANSPSSQLDLSANDDTANFVDVMPRNIAAPSNTIRSLYTEPIWSGVTANDTPAEIFLYGESNKRFVLTNNSAITYELRIVAIDSSGDTAEYVADGLIYRGANAASTTLLKRYAIVTKYEDDSAWDANITADTTNGSLKITVTGDSANTTKWTVAGRLTEVRY